MNKKDLVEKILVNLQKEADETKKLFESARQAAIDAPGAMQSKSDTTKFQVSRLAENISSSHQQIQKCMLDLRELDLSESETVKIGSLVKVEENQKREYYFILPADCGNQSVEFKDQKVIAIAAKSPIVQALLGRKINDTVNIKVPAGARVLKILEID